MEEARTCGACKTITRRSAASSNAAGATVLQNKAQRPSIALGIYNLECFIALLDGWLGPALLIGCRFATGQHAADQQCLA